MTSFQDIRFRGTFRDYQQAVLDHADRHLADRRVHIVAAPGSGKTILGLELIRRLNAPALILSPSVTIRQQWGDRFASHFLPEGRTEEEYISYRLSEPALLTSVTYQALHAAWTRTALTADSDPEAADEETGEDFSDFDLVRTIREAGVRTICLDEAHHLRSEWQKALEAFLKELDPDQTCCLIALTATPPYDSTPAEWDRYIRLCGEIDEEIFVPQLVAQKTLCPHQDYIYFNYPDAEETTLLKDYKQRAMNACLHVLKDGLLAQALSASVFGTDPDPILEYPRECTALFCTADKAGLSIPTAWRRRAVAGGRARFGLSTAETAFQFILDHPELFTEEAVEALRSYLAGEDLIEQRRVQLVASQKLNRMLISSSGKLRSITAIVQAEAQSLGSGLRMLILTDYIKKDLKRRIGTEEPLTSLGTVPVFETLRRKYGRTLSIGLLSGTLVILPDAILPAVTDLAAQRGIPCSAHPLGDTAYSEVTMAGSNKNKVAVITEAFRQGLLQVLVGTKSLLGEGWDSPCINSLILASFVGSFMLSNQMRGRAIRTDSAVPDKTANIWHLVTVEPPMPFTNPTLNALFETALADPEQLTSSDLDTLERRFDCFLAPAYHANRIESGIARVDILKPPYTPEGIAAIDQQMLALAADRAGMARRWDNSLQGSLHPEVLEAAIVPPKVQPQAFLFSRLSCAAGCAAMILYFVRSFLSGSDSFLSALLVLAALVLFLYFLLQVINFSGPRRTVRTLCRCVLQALQDQGDIQTPGVRLQIRGDSLNLQIYGSLTGATAHEKTLFAQAMAEMLSAIDNPRYLLIRQPRLRLFRRYHCKYSYACPSQLGHTRESAESLARSLSRCGGRYAAVYTRNEAGAALLRRCQLRSRINRYGLQTLRKEMVQPRRS